MSDGPVLTTRDIVINIQDTLSRMEEKQDALMEQDKERERQIAEINAAILNTDKMLKAAWAVIAALVFGIISIAFFVLQSSLRIGIVPS